MYSYRQSAYDASLKRSDCSATVSSSSASIDLLRSNASLWGSSYANSPEAGTDRTIPVKLEDEGVPSQAPVAENSPIEPDEPKPEFQDFEMHVPARRRRRRRGRIMDKYITLHGNVLRARISNCRLELRCESVSEDVVNPRPTSRILLRRAAHAGHRIHPTLGKTLSRMYRRNLVPVHMYQDTDGGIEEMSYQCGETSHQAVLQNVSEESEPQPMASQEDFSRDSVLSDAIVPQVVEDNIADLPTQVIETHPQQTIERSEVCEIGATVELP